MTRLEGKRRREDRAATLLLRGLGALPPAISLRLGAGAGRLLGLARRGRRARVARINVELCFPDRPPEWRERIVRESLVHDGRSAVEAAIVWTRDPAILLRRVVECGLEETIGAAQRAGHGVLALVPHMAAWELINPFVTARYPATILYKPNERPALDALIFGGRNRVGATLVPANESGVRAVLRALRRGGVTAVLPDQVPDAGTGVFAPFYGHPTLTATLSSKLARVKEVRVVTVCCLREPGGMAYRLEARDADPGVYDDDLLSSVTAVNRTVEAAIARDPGQYHWAYRRFKRPPPGVPNPYAARAGSVRRTSQ